MAIPPDQQAHRDALGKAVTVWMKRNGWSQQTFHDWATAAGSEGPWNSQMSLYSRGRLDPKSQFWVSIGRFNAAVASQDFPCVTNRNLRDRLTDAQPFLNAHGAPASAAQSSGGYPPGPASAWLTMTSRAVLTWLSLHRPRILSVESLTGSIA